MSLKENSEETLSSTTTTVQNFLNYRPFELDLSDDGSIASEPDHEHSSKARRSSTGKQRRSSTASQLSPSISSSLQLGGPLPSYPVSLRKQIAIIKQHLLFHKFIDDIQSRSLFFLKEFMELINL
ncbi:unnamed protein product [Dracunculus medinensis]|uniref:Uncharacterized protein n=1 Tax=Dracunculus medinensis TaxID=318479 RepID=A0A0N4UB30_DRAME|nr:unnamed protein product [Dracunculus medinensis]